MEGVYATWFAHSEQQYLKACVAVVVPTEFVVMCRLFVVFPWGILFVYNTTIN